MDYLPLPDGVVRHAPVVELPGIPYDNKGFNGYDIRSGWNTKLLREGNIKGARSDWNEYSQACLAEYGDRAHELSNTNLVQSLIGPFIQNWIIYGLFQEALGRPIGRSEVTQVVQDENARSCRHLTLHKLFREFVARRDVLAEDAGFHEHFPECLDTASWVLEDLDALYYSLGAPPIPGPTAVVLSALIRTMHDYAIIWCHPNLQKRSGSCHVRWLDFQLEDRGWCPERIRRLRVELDTDGLYYASLLEGAADGKTHDDCTQDSCVAHNVTDYDNYKQQHISRFCACKDSSCDHESSNCACRILYDVDSLTQETKASVRQDKVPLVKVCNENGSDASNARLEVLRSHEGLKYVAISHVWSDGMGNAKQNAILPCQMRYLECCVEDIFKQVQPDTEPIFWLDTLCVPVLPREDRALAIEKMRDIYAEATAVLIITSELRSRPLPSTAQETIVRISQSKWLKRLWTMQEGVLARSLYFQFSDKAISYSNLDDHLHREIVSTADCSVLLGSRANLLVSNLTTMHSSAAESVDHLFESLWFNIRHRATSRLSDQAICVAILCNRDLTAVLAASDENKMRTFWETAGTIPLGILFANGPRFDMHTLRWAPKSLLHPSTWALLPPRTGLTAKATDKGLCFSGIDAFHLEGVALPTIEDSMIEFSTEEDVVPNMILLEKNVGNPSWAEIAPHWTSVCLLWRRQQVGESFSHGVLVSLDNIEQAEAIGVGEGKQVLNARWLAQVAIFDKGGDWATLVAAFPTRYDDGEALEKEELDVLVHGGQVKMIPRERQWCVY